MYHSLISRALRVRRAYAKAHGRAPHLPRPRRFTEKIQWRKIFDFNPVFPTLYDKIAVREYIAGRIGREHLLPLLWSGAPAEISFDGIARPFFLKSTHSSGQVIMVGRDDNRARRAPRPRARSCSCRYLRCRYLLLDRRVDPLFMVGLLTLRSDEADFELGSYWRIPSPGWRSIIAELFREPAFSPRRGALTVTPSAANVAS